ncbi:MULTISPECIES: TetR/AcrR family transcriptional regulator [Nocardia]|uniref:TetR/AcrR family transcriptional regulator n=1 Tax=Nocardia TaxID=1817 RepID=UPI0013572606|nr:MULTISPECIES: TetR/AcrR family transcriptional regulator [Nocardia]
MSHVVRKHPRQRRSKDTVDVLLEAAAQMFTREGLTATTNRIAERAGVSIGTLYQYFPDKHAMLHTLAMRHLFQGGERLGQVSISLRTTEPPFEETMRAIVDVVVDLHRDRPALHALLHRVAARLPGELAALLAFEDYLVDEIGYHLERCGRGGDDAALTARTLVHAVDAQVHRVLTRHELTTDEVMVLVHRLTPGIGE